jgi:AraC-like DNA-binding protein
MRQSHDQASNPPAASSKALPRETGRSAPPAAELSTLDAGTGIDPLSHVLQKVRLTGALFFVVDATSPWGVEVPPADVFSPVILPRAQHVVSYHIVLSGSGWAHIPGVTSTSFEAGDILVIPHGDAYGMFSAPGQTPEFDADASVTFFREMAAGRLPFVVHEGGGGPDGAKYVCGFLGCDIRPFNPVLATLPRLWRIRPSIVGQDDLLGRLIDLTLAEARTPRAGGESIRLRLSELIFVEVVRRHLETLPTGETGWLAGLRDPAIGQALTMLHERPAYPWTLGELARRAAMSRAALAARFTHLVGHAPMHYLALWRMQMAAGLLADGSMKVAAVGHEVGYTSEAAFSRAFKKLVGVSPAEWRDSAAGNK